MIARTFERDACDVAIVTVDSHAKAAKPGDMVMLAELGIALVRSL